MKKNETQERLSKYQEYQRMIKCYGVQINELRNNRVMTAEHEPEAEIYIQKLRDLQTQRVEKIEAMTEECEEILRAIESLQNENEKIVMTLRYLKGMRWEEIWQQMEEMSGREFSLRRIYQIHGNALQKIKF